MTCSATSSAAAASSTRRANRSPAGPTRGRDVEAEVTLGFDEAVHGSTLPLQLSGPATCKTCHGSGARPGTAPHQCPTCGGSGFVSRSQGAFGFSEPCRDCQGTGQIIDDPCPDCHGSGVTTQTRTITVRVPAGVRDGAKLRIAGKGTPGTKGGPAGDLFVTVHVRAHSLFGRNGDDLTITVPVTFSEAALGATIRVPTLDGSVALKVAPGTPSGRTMRVRGRGVAKRGGGNGDLLVTVTVAVPQSMSGPAREALAGVRDRADRRSAPGDHGCGRRGRARGQQRSRPCLSWRRDARGLAEDAPVFVISVAAQLAGMHAQTLRQYDRLGLVTPGRTGGGGRRYSARDVALLREVQRLSHDEGVNLAGIKRIIELESQVDALRERLAETMAELRRYQFSARPSTALVVWRPGR